jgi:hypothetical protein
MTVQVGEYRIFRPNSELAEYRERSGDAVTVIKTATVCFKIRSIKDGREDWAVEEELEQPDAEETERFYGLTLH